MLRVSLGKGGIVMKCHSDYLTTNGIASVAPMPGHRCERMVLKILPFVFGDNRLSNLDENFSNLRVPKKTLRTGAGAVSARLEDHHQVTWHRNRE